MTGRGRLLAIAVLLLVVAAGCSTPGPGPTVTPALPPGVAADQPVELFLGLARDQDGLAQLASVTNPAGVPGRSGGPIPLSEVATRFGATDSTRAAVSAYFPGDAITWSATGGFARLVLPIADAQREFGLGWQVVTVGDVEVLTATGTPTVPDDLRDEVTEVLPRNRVLRDDGSADGPGPSAADPAPTTDPAVTTDPAATEAPAVPADPTACAQARRAGAALVAGTGLDRVHAAGFGGAGARVTVIAVADVEPAAISAWLDCIGHPDVAVRGLLARASRPPAAANVEGQLDIAAVTLALPRLDALTLVEAGNADWVGDALATALTDPAGPPQVIVSSVVFCEKQLTPDAIRLTEYVLAAAVAGGTLVVAASGDRGSSACAPADTAAAVGYPASSPSVLAVGGVDGSGAVWARPADRVAAGGGASAVFPGRRLPDLAAPASAPDLPAIPVCTDVCGWQRYAGTSFAAPFVAGALIAVNQARAANGRAGVAFGVGGVDRTLDPGAVVDVTQGSNDVYGVGCCTAGPGFDEASGYGIPRFDVLAGG